MICAAFRLKDRRVESMMIMAKKLNEVELVKYCCIAMMRQVVWGVSGIIAVGKSPVASQNGE